MVKSCVRYGRIGEKGKARLVDLAQPLKKWCIKDCHFVSIKALRAPDCVVDNLRYARNAGLTKILFGKSRNGLRQFTGRGR